MRAGERHALRLGRAAWFDPAIDFASIPMHHVLDALAGYEELAALGAGDEGRILRAVIGQAVRIQIVGGWTRPMDDLMRFVTSDVPARRRDWVVLA
ncbi:MAG: hypothetical protein JWM53_6629 [bacterium]|nr:hypothetical protein [bacterium]